MWARVRNSLLPCSFSEIKRYDSKPFEPLVKLYGHTVSVGADDFPAEVIDLEFTVIAFNYDLDIAAAGYVDAVIRFNEQAAHADIANRPAELPAAFLELAIGPWSEYHPRGRTSFVIDFHIVRIKRGKNRITGAHRVDTIGT